MGAVSLGSDGLSPKIGAVFTDVVAQTAAGGYSHLVLLPGSSAWVKSNGKLGVLDAIEKEIDIKRFSDDFVAARVGICEFHQVTPGYTSSGGKDTSFIAFKTATERDALIEGLFKLPMYDRVRQGVIKAEWKDGKLDIPLDNTVQLVMKG